MGSLAEFLRKYSRLILFLILFFISIWMMILQNRFQQVVIFNFIRRIEWGALSQISAFRAYFYLNLHNKSLAEENARLRNQLAHEKYKLYVGGRIHKDTILRQVYTYYPAEVINITTNKQNNYMTLNIGSIQGAKPDMGVVTGEGIAGIVKMVSPHYSVALILLHSKARIPARLLRSSHFGTLEWRGGPSDRILLNYIPSHVNYKPGDTVVVSSLSSVFPQGFPVGTVVDGTRNSEEGYLTITIKPFVDFHRIRHVYLIDFSDREELKKIESESGFYE